MATRKKRNGEPPNGVGGSFESWTPGTRPPWLDDVLAGNLPYGKRGGRSVPKWGQQVRDMLISALAGCGSLSHAARVAGVEPRNAERWLQRGREDQERWEAAAQAGEDPGDPTEWHMFARQVTLASGWWTAQRMAKLQALAEDPATPAAVRANCLQWLLSRVGDKLSERVEVEHSGGVSLASEMADEMRAKLEEMRARKAAAASEDDG